MAYDKRKIDDVRNTTDPELDQRQERREIQETQVVNTIAASGSINTLRNDQGVIVLYESPDNPDENVSEYRQYIDFPLQQRLFNRSEVLNAIDYKITEISRNKTDDELLNEFFSSYNRLIDLIPALGEERSLESMINQKDDRAFVNAQDFEELSDSLSETSQELQSAISTRDTLAVENQNLLLQIESLQSIINQLTNTSQPPDDPRRPNAITL